ncbi:MAG: hypothetical protein IJS03_07285 [Eubacterium sp.]|nr:hypothetical protein [Eubacterium sp.]
MKREFVIKSIVAPLIVGVVLSAFMLLYTNSRVQTYADSFSDVKLAYFDEKYDTSKVVDKEFKDIKTGDCIGEAVFGSSKMPIVVNAPYSMLYDAVSLDTDSAEFGRGGYVYLKTNGDTLSQLEKSISFYADGCFDKTSYVLVDTMTFDSVAQLKAYAPALSRAAVVYAAESAQIGVKSGVRALIFEEVQL